MQASLKKTPKAPDRREDAEGDRRKAKMGGDVGGEPRQGGDAALGGDAGAPATTNLLKLDLGGMRGDGAGLGLLADARDAALHLHRSLELQRLGSCFSRPNTAK